MEHLPQQQVAPRGPPWLEKPTRLTGPKHVHHHCYTCSGVGVVRFCQPTGNHTGRPFVLLSTELSDKLTSWGMVGLLYVGLSAVVMCEVGGGSCSPACCEQWLAA